MAPRIQCQVFISLVQNGNPLGEVLRDAPKNDQSGRCMKLSKVFEEIVWTEIIAILYLLQDNPKPLVEELGSVIGDEMDGRDILYQKHIVFPIQTGVRTQLSSNLSI